MMKIVHKTTLMYAWVVQQQILKQHVAIRLFEACHESLSVLQLLMLVRGDYDV